MGSKDSRGGGGGGFSTVTSVTGQGGHNIDLTDYPLRYGNHDSAISGATRAMLEAQETKRLDAKVEYGYALDADGNLIGEKRGGRGSCSLPASYYMNGEILTHNHPRTGDEAGTLGGTFSTQDFKVLTVGNLKTMRASAAEGTYSITKGKNFDGAGLLKYRRQLEKDANAAAKKRVQEAGERYKRGEISSSQLTQAAKDASNRALVSIHNGLLAGQKDYGYSYTLERRA